MSYLDRPNDFLIHSNDLHEIRILDRAIRFARSDIICLVQDDDLIPRETDWLEAALGHFIRDVPGELFDSMRVDGASEWATLWHLAFPLTRPALVTVSIYNGLAIWNGFLLPLILIQSPNQRTLPLALWSFQGQYSVNVPAVLASVVLTTLPILILYVVGRRQLLSGLTAGFSK
jgi:ABC-type maltose transport system permease subunit